MNKNRILAIILLFFALSLEVVQNDILTALGCLGAFIFALFLGNIIWKVKNIIIKKDIR